MEILYGGSLLLLLVLSPFIFVAWAIRTIYDLKSRIKVHNNDIDMLSDKVLRLQNSLRKLEEKAGRNGGNEFGAAQINQSGIHHQNVASSSNAYAQGQNNDATLNDSTLVAAFEKTFDPVMADSAAVSHAEPTGLGLPPELAGGKIEEMQLPPEGKEAQFSENMIFNSQTPGGNSTPANDLSDISREFEPLRQQPGTSAGRPKKSEPRNESLGELDMESMIGGNLMSKIGALLLVIGLALFLKYTLGSMGPMAKLAVGAILGGGLLAWGIILNKRDSDDVLSLGLIGGGWACLYLTAFAAHGVDATKVVDSPILGMLLMLVVAGGMIGHSLYFASETAVGLSFLLAFVSLFVSEVSLFSEVAAAVLTIGMLVLSYRYSWHQLAVSGLILCYGSMLARLHWRASPKEVEAVARLTFTQSLLLVNWVTFEMISMNFLRRNSGDDQHPTRFVFILNFFFYLSVSLLAWPHRNGPSLAILAGSILIQYFVSGVLRGFWCQAPGEAAVERQKFFLGSLEDCLAIASVGLCTWLWYVLPPIGVAVGWALAGLLVIEVAFRAPWQLLRFTGHSIVTIAFLRLFMVNMGADELTFGVSYRLLTVIPVIFLMVHLYFRTDVEIDWEASPTGATKAFAPVYSYFGAALTAFLIRFELGYGLTAPAWAIAAIGLTLAGNHFNNRHFARQAIFLVIGAVGYGISTDLRNAGGDSITSNTWFIGAALIAALYINRWLSKNEPVEANDTILKIFDVYRREISSLAGSALFAYLLYLQISGGYLTLAWAAMGIILLTAGFFIRDRVLRLTGLGTAMVCILKVFLYDARFLDAPFRILAFICLGGALILISWAYTRFKERFEELL